MQNLKEAIHFSSYSTNAMKNSLFLSKFFFCLVFSPTKQRTLPQYSQETRNSTLNYLHEMTNLFEATNQQQLNTLS